MKIKIHIFGRWYASETLCQKCIFLWIRHLYSCAVSVALIFRAIRIIMYQKSCFQEAEFGAVIKFHQTAGGFPFVRYNFFATLLLVFQTVIEKFFGFSTFCSWFSAWIWRSWWLRVIGIWIHLFRRAVRVHENFFPGVRDMRDSSTVRLLNDQITIRIFLGLGTVAVDLSNRNVSIWGE